jgi:16S rRNA (guanine527-N7)-methyltransferase
MPDPRGWRGEWPSADALRERVHGTTGVILEASAANRLLEFLGSLERWAAKFNLISVASKDEVIDRHLLDSLMVDRWIDDAASVADLGSGAGFPGIPLAIVRPDVRFHLVESRSHRANFLRQAVRVLGLANAGVFEGRGDAFASLNQVDLVVARAVRVESVLEFADSALNERGRAILMTKAQEPDVRSAAFRTSRRYPYRLPGAGAHALVELVRA